MKPTKPPADCFGCKYRQIEKSNFPCCICLRNPRLEDCKTPGEN